jgi:hypothetical protein
LLPLSQPRVLFGLVLFAFLLLADKEHIEAEENHWVLPLELATKTDHRIFGSSPCHYPIITLCIRDKPMVDSYCGWFFEILHQFATIDSY